MRAVRLGLGLALLALVVTVWQRRAPIVDAYTEERPPVQFEFDGLDFEIDQRADLGPSPLLVPPAPDTKAASLPVLLADVSEPEASIPAGSVDFSGVVTDEFGPVPFATVRLEYHAVRPSGGAPTFASLDITCDEGGRWELKGVGGGRWRVRAFVPDQLASIDPVARFISAGERVTLDLAVIHPAPALVLGVSFPESRFLGESGTIAVSAGRRRVDAGGIVVIDPVPGLVVEISIAGTTHRAVSALSTLTDGGGAGRFGAVCDDVGSTTATFQVAAATIDAAVVSSALFTCLPPPPPEPLEGVPADGDAVPSDGQVADG